MLSCHSIIFVVVRARVLRQKMLLVLNMRLCACVLKESHWRLATSLLLPHLRLLTDMVGVAVSK